MKQLPWQQKVAYRVTGNFYITVIILGEVFKGVFAEQRPPFHGKRGLAMRGLPETGYVPGKMDRNFDIAFSLPQIFSAEIILLYITSS